MSWWSRRPSGPDPAIVADLEHVIASARKVAIKWQEIRAGGYDAAWDDFTFYKGNARWSAGAVADLEALQKRRFASLKEAYAAARALLRARPWDPDYDEPSAARGEMLEAIDAIEEASAARGRRA